MLGFRIREIRKRKGLTLNELAEKTQFTSGYLSQIERDLIDPSLSSLRKISYALDVSITAFLVDEMKDQILIRANERKKLYLPYSSAIYEFITPMVADKTTRSNMDIIYFELNPRSWDSEEYLLHESDECLFVLEGTIEMHDGNNKYELHQGDSLYIREHTNHKFYNPNDEKAVGISTICPPLY